MIEANYRKWIGRYGLPAVVVLVVLVILGCWVAAYRLNRQVTRALAIQLRPLSVQTPQATPGPGMPPSTPGPPNAAPPAGGAEYPKELAELSKKKGLFGLQPEPPPQLQAIFGDSVLIGGQWVKQGESQGNTKVKEILGDKVKVEWNGQPMELTVWPKLPGT